MITLLCVQIALTKELLKHTHTQACAHAHVILNNLYSCTHFEATPFDIVSRFIQPVDYKVIGLVDWANFQEM